jgi:Ca-activated chloride channel family protein
MRCVEMRLRADRRSVEPGVVVTLAVVVELVARGPAVEAERPPMACALALDVSGSMQGEPIEQLIASVDKLTELTSPTDQLAVAVFSDGASEIVPLTSMDPAGKRLVRSRVHRLVANGRTNLEAGLEKAAALLASAPEACRKSVLLLSDGVPNVGRTSTDALAELVRGYRKSYSVSSLGYGPDHHEDVLAGIANAGGGSYRFIPHPASCRRELAQALGAQGDVVADGLELTIVPADGVEILRLYGTHRPRFGAGLILPLADMEDGGTQRVALELRLTRPLSSDGELFRAKLVHRAASTRELHERSARATIDVRSGGSEPDLEGLRGVYVVRGEALRAEARAQADRGSFEGAAAMLRAFLREVDASPGFIADDGSELAELREALLDEAVAYERRPSAEAYSTFRKHTMVSKRSLDAAAVPSRTSKAFGLATAGNYPEAYVVVLEGPTAGARHRLRESNPLGRTKAAAIMLPSPSVSRMHAEIYALEGDYWICDLGTTNSTIVNGARLGQAPHKLAHGDEIALGDVRLRYEQAAR